MVSDLYKRHFYVNKSIDSLVNNEIIEYDMKSADISIIESKGLLSEEEIELIKSLPKKVRNTKIGKMQKRNKELVKELNKGFTEYRKLFIETNEIDDSDIISIKKDAIFTTKRCDKKSFDKVQFVEKNIYTSYYYFRNGIEIYYNKNRMDVKGINDDKLKNHKEYFASFINRFCFMGETSSLNNRIKFLNEFTYLYKTRNLDIQYYREFNANSFFRAFETITHLDVGMDCAYNLKPSEVDIKYNFFNYLVPMINMLI